MGCHSGAAGSSEDTDGPEAGDGEDTSPTSTSSTDSGSSGPDTDGQSTFCDETDVQEIFVRNACIGCHMEGAAPKGGGIDLMSSGLTERLLRRHTSNATCPDDVLVDDEDHGASLLLRAVAPGRYAGHGSETCLPIPMPLASPTVMPPEDVECIEEWIRQLDESDLPPGEQLEPLDAFSVASKVKFVLHGGALTYEELEAVTAPDGTADAEALGVLVDALMQTPEYRIKRRQFLELTLQQTPADPNYFFQFRNTRTAVSAGLRESLRLSFIRTAERIIDSGEDFRSIVTTREWEVTTLTLLALKMTDNPPNRTNGRVKKNDPMNDMRHVLSHENAAWYPTADAEDWRTVSIVQDPSSTHMTEGENFIDPAYAEELRNIPEGGTVTLRAPRLGFFTTPAFFQTWATNRDNEFRVTTNQALLVALGRTLTPGDPTPRNVGDEGVDLELFPLDSDCYGCHKQMEGMRAVWLNAYDHTYSRQHEPEEPAIGVDFSFAGISEPISDLNDWAEVVANHPAFAKAWALKVCQWVSSTKCDEHGETVKALARGFEESGFDFNVLMRELLTSDLVTHTSFADDAKHPGAEVSIARYGHYCHAMKTRLGTIRGILGESPTGRTDICEDGDTQKLLASNVPQEQWIRGDASLHQPSSFGAMSAAAFEGLCSLAADDVVGSILPDDDPEFTLDLMTSELLGRPEGSEAYDDDRQILATIYETLVATPVCSNSEQLSAALANGDLACGMGVSEAEALVNVWKIVCQSPALTGVGL